MTRPVIPIRPIGGDAANDTQFVSMCQKAPHIYPRSVKGWFVAWRWIFVWLTQLFFYGLPRLQWGGRQAALFDLEAQRFYYGALLGAAGAAFAVSVALRSPFQFDIIKDRGALARIVDDGAVENVYRIRIMNRTEAPQTYRVAATGIEGLSLQARELTVPAAGIDSIVASVRLPADLAQAQRGQSAPIEFEVASAAQASGHAAVLRNRSTFHVPC